MSKEAIAHYEAALKEAFPRGATGEVFHHWNEARYLIATEALERMAENARELGLDYEQYKNAIEVSVIFHKGQRMFAVPKQPAPLIDLDSSTGFTFSVEHGTFIGEVEMLKWLVENRSKDYWEHVAKEGKRK